jgi:hypothetical protein
MEEDGTNKYNRNMMALLFLLHEHIRQMFVASQKDAAEEKLQVLYNILG